MISGKRCTGKSIRLTGAVMVAALTAGLACAGPAADREEQTMTQQQPLYSAREVQLEGRTVVVLSRGGETPLEAKIMPSAGASLFSLVYNGVELIMGPESLADFNGASRGNPVLYPAPNRVAGGKFSFEGRTFDFGLNDGDRWLHALVRDIPWEYEVLPATGSGVAVHCWVDFSPGTALFEKFGFDHRLNLTFTLDSEGLLATYKVENRGDLTLPYGFALHPYFTFPGPRDSAYLCVPARKHMEAVNLMPTGKLEELEGKPWDITKPVPVPSLVLDDVYWGMTSANPAWIEYRQNNIKVTLAASEEFTHMVVYIQPQNNFFCVENQTCSTDAHNLYARGLVDESHLLFAGPGESREGWVHFKIQPLR
jgi:aldose 1-epimerase